MGTTDDDDLREQFGPDGEPAEPSAPEEEPAPVAEEPAPVAEEPAPVAEEVDPGPPTEPVVVWDDGDEDVPPAAPVVTDDDEVVVVDAKSWWPSRVRALLALALIALFFVPWFDADGFLRSSGAGLVGWTDQYIVDLPEGAFERQMLVPYLAVLIPIGALVVCALAIVGRQVKWLTIATALVAPLLLAYALIREGGDVFRVLEAGAYLTLAVSLGLLASAFGLLASRWGRVTLAGGLALAVVAAFVIPAAVQDDVDSPLFAAYAANRTSLEDEEAPEDTDDEVATATTTTTLVVTASTVLEATTTTTAATSTTRATVAAVTSGCPSSGPTSTLEIFHFDQAAPGSDNYFVDVRGITENRTGASINVSSIEVAVRRNGTEVGRISIPANRTLASGQALDWFRDDATIVSPGAPPSSADVVSVPYSWSDGRFASCARP